MKLYDQTQVDEVARAFLNHQIIAMPTDTVYGVGVIYGTKEDLDHLKHAKHRPETKPIPMMVANADQMERVAAVDARTRKLIDAFLPGPLTLILPSKIDPVFTNGLHTIAMRIPDDAFILKVIEKLDIPLFVTSANQSGAPTALTYDDALVQLPNIDGCVKGECKDLWASTIVDCTGPELKILRQGPIKLQELKDAAM